jgi:hypothetical protein
MGPFYATVLLGRLFQQGQEPEDPEAKRLHTGCVLLAAGGLLLAVGLFQVQKDLRLRLFGVRAQAEITEIWRPTNRRGEPLPEIAVNYVFTDQAGQARTSGDRVGRSFSGRVGEQVEIVYFADRPGTSKLVENTSLWYLALAGIGLVIMAIPVAALFHGARMPAGRPGRSGRA